MDAYKNSLALKKLQRAKKESWPLRLAFFDLDGTWVGPPQEQQTVYDLLEQQNYVTAQVTSRTGGFLDPDILISVSGTCLFIKQNDGSYQEDIVYAQRLPQSLEAWHKQIDELLSRAEISKESYTVQRVGPAYCRVEIALESPAAAEDMIAQLRSLVTQSHFHFARETRNFFITPARTSKEDAVNHVVATLVQILSLTPQDLHVVFAGDTAIEIPMGFTSAVGSQATFLIPGGAPATQEPELMTKLKKSDRIASGVYWFPDTHRNIVIGDEAFPNTIGPQTLIVWLKKNYA